MKQMACKDLGGACDVMIRGNTPEELGENCKQHALRLAREGDEDHRAAMRRMEEMSPGEFATFWADFRRAFDAAEEIA